MFRFNYDNVVVGTNFDEWVASICAEINRVLSIDRNSPLTEAKIKLTDWGKNEAGELIKAQEIYATDRTFDLSFAEMEYRQDKKYLYNLLQVRLADSLWSLESLREIMFETLRQFDPEWKTPDDYVH